MKAVPNELCEELGHIAEIEIGVPGGAFILSSLVLTSPEPVVEIDEDAVRDSEKEVGLPLNRDEGILDLVTKGIVWRYLWWLNWAHAHGFFGGGVWVTVILSLRARDNPPVFCTVLGNLDWNALPSRVSASWILSSRMRKSPIEALTQQSLDWNALRATGSTGWILSSSRGKFGLECFTSKGLHGLDIEFQRAEGLDWNALPAWVSTGCIISSSRGKSLNMRVQLNKVWIGMLCQQGFLRAG
eukprot:scaffold67766_cov52-Cyclotella_meneghiniana.AAC.3